MSGLMSEDGEWGISRVGNQASALVVVTQNMSCPLLQSGRGALLLGDVLVIGSRPGLF